MSTARQVVDRLVESNIRRLISAGFPRQDAKRKIAQAFERAGYTILDMSDKGYSNAVRVCFTVPGAQAMYPLGGPGVDPSVSYSHSARFQMFRVLDAELTDALGPKVYREISFPSTGWSHIEGGEEEAKGTPRPIFFSVVVGMNDYSGGEYRT